MNEYNPDSPLFINYQVKDPRLFNQQQKDEKFNQQKDEKFNQQKKEDEDEINTLFVGNLSPDYDKSYISELFQKYGSFKAMRLLRRDNRQLCAFIDYTDKKVFKNVLLQTIFLDGRKLTIEPSNNRNVKKSSNPYKILKNDELRPFRNEHRFIQK